jgi:hypothetical protein
MSDSLFMATAILARAGKLTGERRYFDMAAQHIAFMQKLVFGRWSLSALATDRRGVGPRQRISASDWR